MAFEFVNQTVVSLFNSLSQLKDIRICDFTFGPKKNKFKKKEAGIARKTLEKVSLEQSFSQRSIDSTSNSLYKVPFAGHTRANIIQSVEERCNSAPHLGHFQSDK